MHVAHLGSSHACRAQGAKVVSNSWGGGGFSQAMHDEIAPSRDAGQLFVIEAGNSALNTDVTPFYPADYQLDNIISVGATDVSDTMASFSNYGA